MYDIRVSESQGGIISLVIVYLLPPVWSVVSVQCEKLELSDSLSLRKVMLETISPKH